MRQSLIVEKVVQGIVPITIIFAIYLLLRGHNEPGGGFIAGLVTVSSIVLQGLAFGVQRTRKRFSKMVPIMIWIGVLICVGSALAGPLRGRPFFTHSYAGALSTALLFDVGVYVAVVGTGLMVLGTIAERKG